MSLNLGAILHFKLYLLQNGFIYSHAVWSVDMTVPTESNAVENAHREWVLIMPVLYTKFLRLNIGHLFTNNDVIDKMALYTSQSPLQCERTRE